MKWKADKEDLQLAFIAEVAAAHRRLETIRRHWLKPAKTPQEFANARQALYLSQSMIQRLSDARRALEKP